MKTTMPDVGVVERAGAPAGAAPAAREMSAVPTSPAPNRLSQWLVTRIQKRTIASGRGSGRMPVTGRRYFRLCM